MLTSSIMVSFLGNKQNCLKLPLNALFTTFEYAETFYGEDKPLKAENNCSNALVSRII